MTSRHAEQIENASIYFEPANGLWFLFTNHVGIDSAQFEFTDAVWVHWSDDPMHFDPACKAVVVDSSASTWSKGVIGMPSILNIGDRLALFYDGNANGDRGHLQRDVGLAYINLPLEPPPVVGDP